MHTGPRIVLLSLLSIAIPTFAQTAPAVSAPAAPAAATPAMPPGYKPFAEDWAQFTRYAAANAALPPAVPGTPRVVFFGDSITDLWAGFDFFPGKGYINRGIGGQTTTQMLVRFQQDVLDLHPAVVVIVGGTNDIGLMPADTAAQNIENNIGAMVIVAKNLGIRVVVGSVPPALKYGTSPTRMSPVIREANRRLRDLCDRERVPFVDYYSSLVGPDGGMKPDLVLPDGLHPNKEGYAVMTPLAEAAIQRALSR